MQKQHSIPATGAPSLMGGRGQLSERLLLQNNLNYKGFLKYCSINRKSEFWRDQFSVWIYVCQSSPSYNFLLSFIPVSF